ncbi:MAG: hypothetical protein BMS9Abin11_0013 [Gammaproteobacteria bacterium]|nr:MAG: hypothetical protein BMS9Abin11_0013 [Gammaproteobacteria bacterium]
MPLAKRAAPVLILALLLLLVWFYHHYNKGGITLCLVGQADNRLLGIVPENLKNTHLDASNIQSALGNVALLGWSSLGDGMVLNQQAWLRTTNKKSPRFYGVLKNRYFQSNYLIYLPAGTKAGKYWQTSHNTDMKAIWSSLARNYGDGVYVSGYIHFGKLNTIAIARPAIDTRPVLQDPAKYYTQPMEMAENTWGYVIGIAARRKSRFWWQQRKDIKKIIPVDSTNSWYIGLAQVMVLNKEPVDFSTPPNQDNIKTFGQLVFSSRINQVRLSLYPVSKVSNCRSAFY